MSSREFDGMLDNLMRQAFYPFADAQPPMRVWRRVFRAVRSMRARFEVSADASVTVGFPVLAGLPATFSRFLGFLSCRKGTNATYVPFFSNRAYYVDHSGRCLTSPFWDIALRQMFDMRLAS